jgi:hypothetical protein
MTDLAASMIASAAQSSAPAGNLRSQPETPEIRNLPLAASRRQFDTHMRVRPRPEGQQVKAICSGTLK